MSFASFGMAYLTPPVFANYAIGKKKNAILFYEQSTSEHIYVPAGDSIRQSERLSSF
jgi:hypothetical protein